MKAYNEAKPDYFTKKVDEAYEMAAKIEDTKPAKKKTLSVYDSVSVMYPKELADVMLYDEKNC